MHVSVLERVAHGTDDYRRAIFLPARVVSTRLQKPTTCSWPSAERRASRQCWPRSGATRCLNQVPTLDQRQDAR